MRILVLKNNVVDNDTLQKGITLATQACQTIGLTLEFSFTDTTRQFTSIPVVNNIILNGYVVNPVDIMDEAKKLTLLKPFDAQILIYDWTKITPEPTNPSDGGSAISIPIQWFPNSPEGFCTIFLHELCHFMYYWYNNNL